MSRLLKNKISHTLALMALIALSATHALAVGECAAPSFNVAQSFSTDKNPNALAVGDLNGDGAQDLAVANYGSDTFSLLFGDGEGAFAPAQNFPVGIKAGSLGSAPEAVAISDFNADGKQDLVVVGGYASGWVSILLGDGAGHFGPANNLTTGALAYAVTVADFNADGKKDLAVAGGSSRKVSVLLGNGAGGFALAANVSVTSDPMALTVADFNGDQVADIAVTGRYFDWNFSIIFGNNAGAFAVNRTFTTHWQPLAITAADFNGDGRTDVAVTTSWSTPTHIVEIRLGDGAGNFGPANEIFIGYEPSSIVTGDFNKDGKSDLAMTVTSGNNVAVLLGDGAGNFAAPRYYGSHIGLGFLAVGDFNKDGKDDLVSTHYYADVVSVLPGNGAGAFATTSIELSGGERIASADLNRDGYADLVMPVDKFGGTQAVEILYGNSSSGVVPPTPVYLTVAQHPKSVAIADFNSDGSLDIAVGHELNNGFISILYSNPVNGFTSSPVPIPAPNHWGNEIIAGDFNGDTRPDLAFMLTELGGRLRVMLNNGAGGFTLQPAVTYGGSASWFAKGDFNRDGKLDLAVANGNAVTILLGDGAGGFAAAPYSPVNAVSNTNYVAVADLNKDGWDDLVTSNNSSNTISVLLNNGTGFAPVATLAVLAPKAIKVADFNLDGNPDLVIAVPGNSTSAPPNPSGNIAVLTGDGTGNFSAPYLFVAGGGPSDFAVEDFNKDGRLDLAVAGPAPTASNTTILLNTFQLLPCLSVGDVQLTEGDTGTTNALFTVSLSAPSTQAVKVNYFIRERTAKSGGDYQAVSGRLVFAPGTTTQTISVPIIGDLLDEPDEEFNIFLSNPLNAAISRGQALATIIDNDPTPTLSISDGGSIPEAGTSSGAIGLIFDVTLSAPSGKTVTVQYATVNATASNGTDFFGTPGTLTFAPGTTAGRVYVQVANDSTYEPDETFFVELSNPTNATIADGQGQGTILNDDPIPTVTVANAGFLPVPEGNSGTTNLSLEVRLSNATYQTVTLNYATSDLTATAGTDYLATSGSVTFNPGETVKTINVQVIGDTLDELNETFQFNLSNVVGATPAPLNQMVGTIFDDDGPAISINDISIAEGNTGTTSATFTLTLSAPSVQDVSVRLSTADDTATLNSDYQGLFNSLAVIPAGSTSVTRTVRIIGDTSVEPNERFFINLLSPSNGSIGDASGIVTILDDDGAPQLQFEQSSYTLPEGSSFINIKVIRTGDMSAPATVKYSTSDTTDASFRCDPNIAGQLTGIASRKCDYHIAVGTLRFAAGESTKQFTLSVVNDVYVEGSESFTLTLSNPSGAPLGTNSSVPVTIIDDDIAGAANPIDNTSFFVRQLYVDLLSREPDPAGWNGWTMRIDQCGLPGQPPPPCDRVTVGGDGFLRSGEFFDRQFFVLRLYRTGLGRILRYDEIADLAYVSGFLTAEQLELNKQDLVNEMVLRTEFANLYNPLGNAGFVSTLLQTAEVSVPQSVQGGWVSALDAGSKTRAQVFREISERPEVSNKYLHEAQVVSAYYGFFTRNPDGAYLNYLQRLDSGEITLADLANAFINAQEYRQRFGQ